MNRTLLALVLALVGCAHPIYNKLPPDAQDDWSRCKGKVLQAQCYAVADVFLSVCSDTLLEKYAKAGATKGWLIRHGCPSEMVD